jgi:hypothetical protein
MPVNLNAHYTPYFSISCEAGVHYVWENHETLSGYTNKSSISDEKHNILIQYPQTRQVSEKWSISTDMYESPIKYIGEIGRTFYTR